MNDTTGDVYVVGSLSDNVFEISSNGAITEIIDASGDGQGNDLDTPWGVAVEDISGSVYVTAWWSSNLFEVTSSGGITELVDAEGAGPLLGRPRGVSVSETGSVYVVGASSQNVLEITPTGVVTEIASSLSSSSTSDSMIAVGPWIPNHGNDVYVATEGEDAVVRIPPAGGVFDIIGSAGDGEGNVLDTARGVAADSWNNVYTTGKGSDNAFKITMSTKDTVGIYRDSDRSWHVRNVNGPGAADFGFPFGDPSDVPLVGDWNGDGTDTIGVYRPGSGQWFLRNSNTPGSADLTLIYGILHEKPVIGNWDGAI